MDSRQGIAVALARGQRAHDLCFEPLAYTLCVAAMLASLAPEQPHIDLVVHFLQRLETIDADLLPLVCVQGVEDVDGLEADGAGGQLALAVKAERDLHLRVVHLLKLQLVSEHFDVGLDR